MTFEHKTESTKSLERWGFGGKEEERGIGEIQMVFIGTVTIYTRHLYQEKHTELTIKN